MSTAIAFSAPVVSSAAESFFRCTRRAPRLAAAEVMELFRSRAAAARAGDREAVSALTERLACAHLHLVSQVVMSYRGMVDEDELISAGNRALMQAINGFDASRGSAFTAYATQWVKQAVARAQYRSLRGSAPFNYRAEEAARKLRAAEAELGMELGRTPSPQELAAHSGKSAAEVRDLLNAGLPSYSLQQPLDSDSSATYGDSLEDSAAESVFAPLNTRLTVELLLHNIRLFLSPAEQTVLRRRLGLGPQAEEASVETIAREMGLSGARVKQLYRSACRRLRTLPDLQRMHTDLCA